MAFENLIRDDFQELIAGLACTKKEFKTFFLQAQAARHDILLEERIDFEILTVAATSDNAAYVMAFTYALRKGWLEILIDQLVSENRLTENYLSRLLSDAQHGSAMLQAIHDLPRGFTDPGISIKGLKDGMRWTGQVEINGIASGSGILIGPNLFLTAWHVVKSLFQITPDGEQPDLTKYNLLSVIFDNHTATNVNGKRQILPTTEKISAAQDWCVAFAPCHQVELAAENPDDLNELNGLWDYTVIKLASPIGLQRRYAKLDMRSVVPKTNDPLIIFQYPRAYPLRVDQSSLIQGNTAEQPFIPKLRFLHNVNTLEGSSGGPCFDRGFNCFGIHQGVWNANTNKGIPLTAILQDIRSRFNELPVLKPEENPIWTLDEEAPIPVVGSETFQSTVWRSVSTGKPRAILISGSEGSGKTFHVRILQKMLGEGAHLKLELNAEAIGKLDVVEFLEYVSEKVNGTLPNIVQLKDENSSPVLWLRDELLPELINLLDNKREGRMVWLLFAEVNHYALEGRFLQDFFYLICQQANIEDWLRIVVDGGSLKWPQTLIPVTEFYEVTFITEAEIKTFLAYYASYLGAQFSDDILRYLVRDAMNVYRNKRTENRVEAVNALSKQLLLIMDQLSSI